MSHKQTETHAGEVKEPLSYNKSNREEQVCCRKKWNNEQQKASDENNFDVRIAVTLSSQCAMIWNYSFSVVCPDIYILCVIIPRESMSAEEEEAHHSGNCKKMSNIPVRVQKGDGIHSVVMEERGGEEEKSDVDDHKIGPVELSVRASEGESLIIQSAESEVAQ